ncbi:MAG: PAS domain-containing protein [Elusimicrobia bacterium]|nr:PAS domain-containing protein [Elusimicrobiota bacterium]
MRRHGNRVTPVKLQGAAVGDYARAPLGGRQKELQDRLDQAEARYRALAERLPIITYVAAMDVQGSFSYISPQVQALLGYAPEEWTAGRSLWLRRMHPEDRPRILPLLGRAHKGGRRFSAEYRLLDRTGRAKWILDESEVIRNAAGDPLLIQGTWTEITERKRMEQETAGRGRELASSKSELEQFISVASHELKAPLRRISNLGEMLAQRFKDGLTAQAEGLLAQIMDSAAVMQGLVAGLVKYGEADPRAPLSAVDLSAAVQHAVRELTEEIAGSGARVTCGTLPTVWAEPALLERVLYNLLDNAIKFRGKEPPRVHVSAEESAKQWIISVRDNGIGIHPRQAQRIFSIFDRLHAPKEYAGVGLGLAVCKKIIERFGGRIWVESEPEEGSTFHFTLLPPPKEGAM